MLATKQGQNVPQSQPTLDHSGAEEASLLMPCLNTLQTTGPDHE